MRLSKNQCHPRRLLDFVPFFKWMPHYDLKANLLNDIIGGLTVGIMHVPQGVFAVVSLMAGSCNQRVSNILREYTSNKTLIDDFDEEERVKISVSILTSLALCVGIIQVAMGLLRLDFLTAFLSDQIIGGFTTGAAVHVFTAQLDKIFGVSIPRHSGPGKLFFIYKELFTSIISGHANWITFAISLCTIILLFFVKTIIDPLMKKSCRIPIPYDLFVMIIGTAVSALLNLHARFGVKIVGKIPPGLPKPSFPDVSLFGYFIADALAISIVSLVVTISMGKLFAKKHNYEIDVRQEFYAMGFMEMLSSLFPVWPPSTALARTLVYESAGTKTQFATVFSSLVLLAVILFIGPLVEVLPVCFLSCIIIVALKGMFVQLCTIPKLWPISRTDCAIFTISFAATVCYDVIEGLLIGACCAVALLIYSIQKSKVIEIGRLSHHEGRSYFQPVENYRDAAIREGVCCVRFFAPLVYLNSERFKKSVEEIIQLPTIERKRIQEEIERKKSLKSSQNESTTTLRNVKVVTPGVLQNQFSFTETKAAPIRAVIIDLSAITQIDYSGINSLIERQIVVAGLIKFHADGIHPALTRQFLAFKKESPGYIEGMKRFGLVPVQRVPCYHF
ncbi:STAS domain protein [Dictyocaulus viviparus]|uniref:STAS domain protein n=1 Tax=Dictyocaulus viviparus TaxID=29172 RepID=A0A0D8XE36_DICVI|nr:STAS domain protein [Dictyocaulus viviparus]